MGKIAGLTDQAKILEALRDRLASVLDGDVGHRRGCECECGVPPDMRTIPSTAKELREVVRDLADMPVVTGGNVLDELNAARASRHAAARQQGAADPVRGGRGKQLRPRGDQAGGDSRAGA